MDVLDAQTRTRRGSPRPLVVVVGAGGLGGPAALTVAARRLSVRLIDDDRVELSNLQRQVLFTTNDIGSFKVEAAAARIRELHPAAEVEALLGRLSSEEADRLLAGAAVVIDATDDPQARFIINAWALAHDAYAVIGGIQRFRGLVVPVGRGHGPCFRCLFDPDEVAGALGCGAIGVVGALAGVIGHLQGEVAAALVAGRTAEYVGRGIELDALSGRVRQFELPEGTGCPACGGLDASVNIRGDRCPMTWVKTRLFLEALPARGLLDIRLRPGEAPRNVAQNLREEGHQLLVDGPMDADTHRLVVRRGPR